MSRAEQSFHAHDEPTAFASSARTVVASRQAGGPRTACVALTSAALALSVLIGCSSLKLDLSRSRTTPAKAAPADLSLAGASAAAAAKSVSGGVKSSSDVQLTSAQSSGNAEELPAPAGSVKPLDPADFQPPGGLKTYPIDLASTLRLAGASHLQIALAKERTREAEARLAQARAKWLPTLQAGVGYTLHDGLMQNPDGSVVEHRSSVLYTGGGASLGWQTPLTGASTGPARLSAQVSLADAIFEPLAVRQTVRAAVAREDAVFHRGMLEAALAFLELSRAHARTGVQISAAMENDRLVKYAAALQPHEDARLIADAAYASAAALRRRQELFFEQERSALASAALARVLQLDASVLLAPAEAALAPLELFDGEKPLAALVADAWSCRPEVAEYKAALKHADLAAQQAFWGPWLPNVYVGYGSGQLSSNSNAQTTEGARSDFDAIALWRLDNLGAGPRSVQRTELSLQRQAALHEKDMRDAVAGETAAAYHKTMHGRRALDASAALVAASEEMWRAELASLQAKRTTIRAAVDALDDWRIAQLEYIDRVTAVNVAQFELLHAVGRSTNLVRPAASATGAKVTAATKPVG